MLYKLLILLFSPIIGCSQNTVGLPDIINYYKGTYNAGLQNWDIKQDKNKIIYVANNEGLLTFDGKYWKLYPLPNKTIVRSVEIDDNRIYVGGQDELGYFSPSSNGSLQYHSITGILNEEDRAFGDVWSIISLKKDIFIRTPNKLFRIKNDKVTVFNTVQGWSYLGVCNNRLYAQESKKRLLVFENDTWIPAVANNSLLDNTLVTAIIPSRKDGLIITTLKNGIFKYLSNELIKITAPALELFEKERIYAATAVSAEWIALATNSGGVHIINNDGQLIQSFTKVEGMQNDNARSIFLDKQSNLWVGLDNGIDVIAYNSAIKRINPLEQDGSGYAAIVFNNYFYAGTSNFLYSFPLQEIQDLSFSRGIFSPVTNTGGQTWGVSNINNKLLLAHHEGAFIVEGNNAKSIAANVGYWNFTPVSEQLSTNRVLSGNYTGLTFLNFDKDHFSLGENIPDFLETSRFVVLDKENNIWVSHPYHGIFKVTQLKDRSYKKQLYTSINGLPSNLNNHVYKIKNEVVIATEKGVFVYNPAKDAFEASEYYKKLLGEQSIRYLKEDTEGNIWFIHEKSLGVVDMTTKSPYIIYLPELKNKMLSGFEFIYPVNEQNIFIGGEKGFFHINFEKYKLNVPELEVRLRSVRIVDKTDSLLFGGYFTDINDKQIQSTKQVLSLNNKWKTIRFEFSSPLFGQQSNLEYSYRLKGFNENWSDWSGKTEKEYTNLPAGNYSFEIRVRNNLGNESTNSTYSFTILPPWYQSIWAYLFYCLTAFVAAYYLYKWQQRKFARQQSKYEEEQKRLQYLHQLEINKAENELVTLRNEKLQTDIDFKNAELATTAMHLLQKGELLTKVKSELNQIMKAIDNEKAIAELKRMIKVLSEDDKTDKDWEHFAQHFDKVHSDFVVGLKEKHPTISANELKLCAYLRMNLSTKEIAQLMNISVRGVEISRYRLRKKLGISSEVNLFDYLINLVFI